MKYLCIVLLLITPSILADDFSVSHSCSKPYKPIDFSDEYEYESFLDEVKEFKECITDFIEEQNDAIRRHQEASQDALDEWNNFVSLELN